MAPATGSTNGTHPQTIAAGAWPLCLLLVQAWVPDPPTILALNPVSWSLACEAFFYLVTPTLIG